FLSAVGCAVTTLWEGFVFFRFLGGIAVGASSVAGPMYISEISPPSIRGRLAGMFQLNIVAGILVAYLTNYLLSGVEDEGSWRYMMGIMAIPAVVFYGLLWLIPESPRWLASKGRAIEATQVFLRLGEPDAERKASDVAAASDAGTKAESLFNGKYNKPIRS